MGFAAQPVHARKSKKARTMARNNCPGCRDENVFCFEHQKHEKAVYESIQFAGKHDTVEYRIAISDARQKDVMDD